jgi:hypothetical protein
VRIERGVPVFAAVFALCACSGSGGSSLPQSRASAAPAKTVRIAISLKIPKVSTAARVRRPAYVSQATQSVALAIDGTLAVAFNTGGATNPNCVTGNESTTCTAYVAAPIGSDTFTLSTYDGALNGSGSPTGNLLSQGTLAQTIAAGTANAVNIALDGVVASLGVSVPPNAITVGTPGTATITVTAYDADGFAIVGSVPAFIGPNGTPLTITVTDDDPGSTTTLIAAPITPQATTATLNYSGFNLPQGRYPTIVASAPGVTSGRVLVAMVPLFNPVPTISNPTGIAAGASEFEIAQSTESCVTSPCSYTSDLDTYVPNAAVTQHPVPNDALGEVAMGSDGRTYVGVMSRTALDVFDPTNDSVSSITFNPSQPGATMTGVVASGSDKRIWALGYGSNSNNSLACFLAATTTAGIQTIYPYGGGASQSCGGNLMASASDGRLWFPGTQTVSNTSAVPLYAATTSGVVSEIPLPSTTLDGGNVRTPMGLTSGTDGNLYVVANLAPTATTNGSNSVGCEVLKIAPASSAVTELGVARSADGPQFNCQGPVVMGAYGDLWFVLGQYNGAYCGCASPEDNYSLGRLDPNGTITIYNFPLYAGEDALPVPMQSARTGGPAAPIAFLTGPFANNVIEMVY